MEDISALLDYFNKIQKTIENADLTVFKYKFVKKNRIDDLLVCTLAILPKSFKDAMKKKFKLDAYPSVSYYNRLYKLLKKPFVLNPDIYIIDYAEVAFLIKTIKQSIQRDIFNLEKTE